MPRLNFNIVDDILAVVPNTRINDVLMVFNNYHPRLSFTFEIENNGSINYLDTTVFRRGNFLITGTLNPHSLVDT